MKMRNRRGKGRKRRRKEKKDRKEGFYTGKENKQSLVTRSINQ